jgi:hypothetical protein
MKRQRKKHTYSPGDVDDISWALFLPLFPGPIILPLRLLSLVVGYQRLRSTLQAVARRAGGRCWVARRHFCQRAVLALVVSSPFPHCCHHPPHTIPIVPHCWGAGTGVSPCLLNFVPRRLLFLVVGRWFAGWSSPCHPPPWE